MNIKRTLTIAVAVGMLHSWAVSAQNGSLTTTNQVADGQTTTTNQVTGDQVVGGQTTTTNQDLLQVVFRATCRAFDSTQGRIVTTRITERTIIAQAVGGSARDQNLTRNFALVYNPAADSLQVVGTNLQPVVDVIHFGGGAAVNDSRQINRFTFLFFPGQTNEFGGETNVFGSAVITERANLGRITGTLQFLLTGGNVLGTTNIFNLTGATNAIGSGAFGTNGIVSVTGTNIAGGPGAGFSMTNSNVEFDSTARICTGTFVATRRALFSTAGVVSTIGVGTGTNGTAAATGTGTTIINTGASLNGTGTVTGTTGTTGTGTTSNIGVVTGTGNTTGVGTITGIGTTLGTGTTPSGITTTPSGISTINGLGTTVGTGTTTGLGTTGTTITGTGFAPGTITGTGFAPGTIETTGFGTTGTAGTLGTTGLGTTGFGTTGLGTTGTGFTTSVGGGTF